VSKRPTLLIPLGVVVVVLLVLAIANTSQGTNVPVAVYPSDASGAANPKTQISFRGARRSAIEGIEVRGSRTGEHKGVLRAHSDGMGASFLPKRPFRPGEKVTVDCDCDMIGSDGVTHEISFHTFEIPNPKLAKLPKRTHDTGGIGRGNQFFKSEPDLHPPGIDVDKTSDGLAPGHIFLAPKAAPGQDGPMIMDDKGNLIWFHPLRQGQSAFDFRRQRWGNRQVLTWWQGLVLKGEGFGYGVIYDDHYRFLQTVHAGNGYSMDLHEFAITPRGTALIIAYKPIRADLHRIADAPNDAAAVDCVIQEIDLKTGLVEFEWHAFDHIKRHDAYAPYSKHKAFDFAHVNSIHEEDNGNLLVSVRNASAMVEVDRMTGHTKFRLGGKRPTLPQQPNTFTIAQHSVSRTRRGAITVFDNGAGAPPKHGVFKGRPARGLVLRQPRFTPGMPPLPVFVETELKVPDEPRHTYSQGSVQELLNNGYMVGWGGDQPWFSEFSNDGQLAFDARMVPHTLDTYRVWKLKWTGHPLYPPKAVVSGGAVYVSWNGATNVGSWQLLGGSSPTDLAPIGDPVERHDRFETRLPLPAGQQYVAVRGISRDHKTLGTSRPVPASGG
jgi:hypothetical protein